MTTPELLTLDEVADILGLSKTSMYRWAADGRLPVLTLPNGHKRVSRDDLNRLIVDSRAGS